ncbi:MAG: hypothetical protein ACK4PK_10860 [Alphaproteobacteria bacterium]
MAEGVLKSILRILVTLTSVPLLLLGVYAALADRSADNPALQAFFAVIAAMALLNIVVAWRWLAAPQSDFSFLYLLCRCFAWALNIVIFAFVTIGVVAMGDARMLFVTLPVGLGLLGLFVTRRKVEAMPSEVKSESAPVVADSFDLKTETFLTKTTDVEEPAFESHRTEITVPDSRRAEITEEDLACRILGRTEAQKRASIIIIPLMVLGLYFMRYGSYIPSWPWIVCSGVLALGFSYPLARIGLDSLQAPNSRFSLQSGDIKWLLPIAAGFLFFTLSYGLGYLLNGAVGDKTRASFAYAKSNVKKECLNVTGDVGQLSTKYCIRREDAAYLPDRGQLDFTGRESWFGVSLDGYFMPFR